MRHVTSKSKDNYSYQEKRKGEIMPLSHVMQFSPVNILRGIVPVASIWDTDPTDLENCTDGNVNTVTGTGSNVMAAAGTYGNIIFDLGSVKTVLVGIRAGIWSTASNTLVYIAASDDNITYRENTTSIINKATVVELVSDSHSAILTGRYVRTRFYLTGIGTAYAKIYEVAAWELTI